MSVRVCVCVCVSVRVCVCVCVCVRVCLKEPVSPLFPDVIRVLGKSGACHLNNKQHYITHASWLFKLGKQPRLGRNWDEKGRETGLAQRRSGPINWGLISVTVIKWQRILC